MQHTLVAVFDNRTDAQNAMNELLSSNFSRQDVRLSNADPTGMTDSVTGASSVNTDADDDGRGIGASIKNFFTDLFGADNSAHVSRYEGAVTRGHHVLTVTADSLPEVERAADIVERYGPTDIDEQASGSDTMGSGAMAGGMSPGMSESMRAGGAGGMQQSSGMAMQSGAGVNQQLDNPGDRKLFAQQSLNQAEPMGQTYQEPMGKSGLSATGGTSLQGSTLQENSVQASALEGTQKSDTSFLSSGQQGGTLQGSTASGAIQSPGSGMGGDPVGSPTHSHLGAQQLAGGSQAGMTGAAGTGSQQLDTGYQAGAGRTDALRSDALRAGGTQSIPVVEEQLQVGKREVQRGGVRIYSRMVETPVNESVNLREEHVDVQRRPVDRPLGDADTAFREQSIEMRETAEEAVVEKSARIVEEVSVGKQVSERQEQIHDTLRHTEVEVQRLDGSTNAMPDLRDDDSYYRKHFTSTYGASGESYDDYAPAYSYGSEMARSGKYSGRQWDQVERDLQSDWDTRSASSGSGASTWEKMKAAVRHGWDRITPDRDDDSYYRSHYDTHLSSSGMDYDSVKPAYSYGAEMRKSELYRNRPWDDIEGDMRKGWDSRIAAPASTDSSGVTTSGAGAAVSGAWDKMKSAVRHGWDRMTDDDDNEREYRSHWNATYSTVSDAGSYDDYKPAYAYGSSMAQDPKYRGRQWGEVENDLRTDWDTRYGSGGQSTWEKMKSAVRHGWDRMTS